MSPEGWGVLSDAIKILGPAIISGFIAYKIAMQQVTLKLKEAEEKHEFSARARLFNYYKEKNQSLIDAQKNLNETLNELMGTIIGVDFAANADDDRINFLRPFKEYVLNNSNLVLKDLEVTKREMERDELKELPEYGELNSYFEKINSLTSDITSTAIQQNIFTLLEIYRHIYSCQHLLLEKQEKGNEIFRKYLSEK